MYRFVCLDFFEWEGVIDMSTITGCVERSDGFFSKVVGRWCNNFS